MRNLKAISVIKYLQVSRIKRYCGDSIINMMPICVRLRPSLMQVSSIYSFFKLLNMENKW